MKHVQHMIENKASDADRAYDADDGDETDEAYDGRCMYCV